LAIHAVFIDKLKDKAWRIAQLINEPSTHRFAQGNAKIRRLNPHPGIHKSHIATRSAKSNLSRLEYHNAPTILRKM
jgi:hypothetical protein